MSPYAVTPSPVRSSLVRPPLAASAPDAPSGAPLGARVARRIVSLCLFCGASRLPARTADAADRWEPLAPLLRARIDAGGPDIVVSHGLCPNCARVHYPELFD